MSDYNDSFSYLAWRQFDDPQKARDHTNANNNFEQMGIAFFCKDNKNISSATSFRTSLISNYDRTEVETQNTKEY